jgi:hypothetical protein
VLQVLLDEPPRVLEPRQRCGRRRVQYRERFDLGKQVPRFCPKRLDFCLHRRHLRLRVAVRRRLLGQLGLDFGTPRFRHRRRDALDERVDRLLRTGSLRTQVLGGLRCSLAEHQHVGAAVLVHGRLGVLAHSRRQEGKDVLGSQRSEHLAFEPNTDRVHISLEGRRSK